METQNSDILIIGGGVIGLSIARAIRKRSSVSITILERGKVGDEASWAAAGLLAPNAERHANQQLQEFCSRSLDLYPRFIDELERETGLSVGFEQNGVVEVAMDEAEAARIEEKFRTLQDVGIRAESVAAGDVQRLEPSITPEARGAIFYPDEGQVDNRLLVEALRKYAIEHDISVWENTCADAATVRGGAGITIVAAGAWSGELLGDGFVPPVIRPIRGQMISFRAPKRAPERVIFGAEGYIAGRSDGRILAGATVEDVGFSQSVDQAAVESLKAAAARMMPQLARYPLEGAWAGLRPGSFDECPLIGRHPEDERVLIATGHYRNGILLTPITAQVMADLVTGEGASPFLEAFDPGRIFRRAAVAAPQN